MDNLKTKFQKTLDALETLDEAIQSLKKIDTICFKKGEPTFELEAIFHDSLVQRFEYTFDSTWKYLLLYLEKTASVNFEIKAPKNIFRTCHKIGLITEVQAELALKMVDHRNASTHQYDSAMIKEIVSAIPSYYKLLKGLLEKAKPN